MENLKRLFLVTITLILIGCASSMPAAGPSKQQMKKADTILIHTNDSPDEAYKKMAYIFQDKNLGLQTSDERLHILRTSPKKLDSSFGQSLSGDMVASFNASVRSNDGKP